MKYLPILIFFCLIASCSTPPTQAETAKANIEAQLQKVLHDPTSYQFVEISPFDSITNLDKMDVAIDFNMGIIPSQQRLLTAKEGLLESQKRGLRYDKSLKAKIDETQKLVDEQRASLKTLLANTEKLIEERKTAPIDTVYNYTTQFSYRAKNKMAATILSTRKVSLSKDMEVLKISEK